MKQNLSKHKERKDKGGKRGNMKSNSFGGVLLLLLFLSLLNFSISTRKAEAQTGLDIAIMSTTPHQTIFYFQRGDTIQVIVDVTYKNNGTVWLNTTGMSYGYHLIHGSWLSYYLNHPALTPPAFGPPNGYQSAGVLFTQMNLAPGDNFTLTLSNLLVYILQFDPDPLPGYYYVYPWVSIVDDNPGNNLPWWSSVPYAKISFVSSGGVGGGIVVPIDKLGLLTPYIGLTSTIIAATVATTIYVKRVKRRKKKQ